MDIWKVYENQRDHILKRFQDIVLHTDVIRSENGFPLKLRLYIIDGSVADVFYSSKGRYSYHWERRPFNGTIYRHDNAPHHKWKNIRTFPKHFHNGQDHNVSESFISDDPIIAVGEFLSFVRQKLIVSNI